MIQLHKILNATNENAVRLNLQLNNLIGNSEVTELKDWIDRKRFEIAIFWQLGHCCQG